MGLSKGRQGTGLMIVGRAVRAGQCGRGVQQHNDVLLEGDEGAGGGRAGGLYGGVTGLSGGHVHGYSGRVLL